MRQRPYARIIVYTLLMAHASDAPVWETWESVFLKTTALGNMIIERSLASGQRITRIAFVPRGGLYLVNILSRMLGLSGDQVICLAVSKYFRENPSTSGKILRRQATSRSASCPQDLKLPAKSSCSSTRFATQVGRLNGHRHA